MKVILHIGAHRCATTTFQDYLRANSGDLTAQGIGFWGPHRTRKGLFSGILPGPAVATGRNLQKRAAGRVRIQLARSAGLGVRQLVISDENILGSLRMNLRMGALYCGVGERMARFAQAFGGQVTDVVLNIRSQDSYWASALGYLLTRGGGVPSQAHLDRLMQGQRGWRDVVTDLACAMPDTRLWVAPFETFAGRPDAQLHAITGLKAPREGARAWRNRTPHLRQLRALLGPGNADGLPDGDGRWQPFSQSQRARMREEYADDVMWLSAGGDGLARLLGDPDKTRAGRNPPWTDMTKGRQDDIEDRRMARAR